MAPESGVPQAFLGYARVRGCTIFGNAYVNGSNYAPRLQFQQSVARRAS
jgi:hypothetical protein